MSGNHPIEVNPDWLAAISDDSAVHADGLAVDPVPFGAGEESDHRGDVAAPRSR